MKHASGTITTRNDKVSKVSGSGTKQCKDGGPAVQSAAKDVNVRKAAKIK